VRSARRIAARDGRGDRGDRGGRPDRGGRLPPEAMVTFAAERRAAAIDEVFAALDRELVGLVPVKRRVEEIGSLLLVDRVRQKFGLSAPRPNLHMCFTGAPGTGKTTVGLLMSDLLHRLGYLQQGHLVHAMRNDLVGEYVGQTAPKTKRVLDRAMGGVLFIDEASALYQPGNSKDFGQEAIEILLQVMENQRDKFIVILAGYADRMETFFESNPGLRSRIAHHLDFADYQLEELVAIGRLMLERASYYLSGEAETAFRRWVMRRMTEPLFANARTVRNDLERARLRHAYRLATDQDHTWSRDDLMRLEAEDIQPHGTLGGSPARGGPSPGRACVGRYRPSSKPYRGWSPPSSGWSARSRSVAVSCSACAADRRSPRITTNGSASAVATSAASARSAASVVAASSKASLRKVRS
jgi:probable Rubsico expression protein CbbX